MAKAIKNITPKELKTLKRIIKKHEEVKPKSSAPKKSLSTFSKYLTPAEFGKLKSILNSHNTAEAKRDLGWIMVMRFSGIRVGAMSQYTLLDAKQALASDRFVIRASINKRSVESNKVLHREVRKALKSLIQLHPTANDADALICSRLKKPMSSKAFQNAIKKWGVLAGIPNVSPHWLRHTYAKEILKQSTSKNPLAIVQSALDHKDIATTAIYTRPDKETVDMELAALR